MMERSTGNALTSVANPVVSWTISPFREGSSVVAENSALRICNRTNAISPMRNISAGDQMPR